MENQKVFTIPKKMLARMQVVHFGKLLFNLQFIMVALMLSSLLSFVVYPLYYVVLLTILGFTVFTAFIIIPNFASWWNPTTLNKITVFLAGTWKYTIPIAAAVSIASIVCLCFDKSEKHFIRITISSAICLFTLAYLFFKIIIIRGA